MREPARVLVVDDEESVVVTIKAILQLDGYEVSTSTTGAGARAMIREREYDLVLTDLRLEDGDGLDVLRAVRERTPETVTIMLTGYASLESAIQELDRTKSQFLSMASHELKTPITAMSGFLQVALRRMRRMSEDRDSAASEEIRSVLEQLEIVYRQTGKLARLIDELLDVSRIQTGRIEFHYADVDIGELANEVATRMQLTTTAHEIAVTRDSTPTIVADRDHLEQVLNNLVTNAIKYSPRGGPITIEVRSDERGVRVAVKDKGIGIPKKELDAIFGLFYRSPDRAARDAAGMGLGLYISREIVSRHGGEIWAESVPAEGSTFFVTLPLVPVGATQPEPARSGAATS